jgi:hypothetical protein
MVLLTVDPRLAVFLASSSGRVNRLGWSYVIQGYGKIRNLLPLPSLPQ